MTTQWERDQIARQARDRRLLALLEAATAAVEAVEDDDLSADLRAALAAYGPEAITGLRVSVEWADREDAHRKREQERIEAGKRAFAELPDAPERRQCEAHVARDMGRWTDFGRCENTATRIVMDWDAKRERVVCTIHAKEFARGEKPGTGFGRIGDGKEKPTHESWYRIKGWCMEPDPIPDPRKPQRFCRVRVDTGSGRHEGKGHRFQ